MQFLTNLSLIPVTSIIRLFKALSIVIHKKEIINTNILKETVKRGFVFSPEIYLSYSEFQLTKLIKIIEKEIGLTPEKMNATFHKSWKKVKEAPIEQLYLEQIFHYITVYGFENLGIYDEKSVYIPYEKLEIPELTENVRLTLIKGYTKNELKEKLLNLLKSGVALKEETIKDVIEIANYVELTEKDIINIKNKEVKTALYDLLDVFPENPVEFLRYVVYQATNNTLLIKNKATIEAIEKNLVENKTGNKIEKLFIKYCAKDYGDVSLSTIFYRFKPLFLAFKSLKKVHPLLNKIRKLAVKNHKPMEEDYLNTVTAKIKKGERINKKELIKRLEEVNIFRKIRLAYALNFRTKNQVDSIVYRIRNGKGWATEFDFNKKEETIKVLEIVLESITTDIEKNVKGKKIYIPKEVVYTLPSTEKQFIGSIPTGSYVKLSKGMIVGIHWENFKNKRVDLDLSMLSETGKIGWNSYYRNEERTLLFSGDVTDAPLPKGATELFYVQRQVKDVNLLFVNNYTYDNYNDDLNETPFTIIVGKTQLKRIPKNYMIDPNEVVLTVKSTVDEKQKMLGMLVITTKECKFYFVESYTGGAIVSKKSAVTENSRKFLFNYYTNTLSLNDILLKAGAELVEFKDYCDINLSPEDLEKDSIIKLLS